MNLGQVVALLFGQAGLHGQLGQAEHAIERCADFVTHGGQEHAFGLAGRFGVFFGNHQFGSAFFHHFFQVVTMLQ